MVAQRLQNYWVKWIHDGHLLHGLGLILKNFYDQLIMYSIEKGSMHVLLINPINAKLSPRSTWAWISFKAKHMEIKTVRETNSSLKPLHEEEEREREKERWHGISIVDWLLDFIWCHKNRPVSWACKYYAGWGRLWGSIWKVSIGP